MDFKQKNIDSGENLGKLLREARESCSLSLDILAQQIKVNKNFLQAIEDGDFKKIPGEFYIRTFVKKYATTVGIRYKKISDLLEKEVNIYNKWNTKILKKEGVKKSQFINFPNILKKIIIVGIILILVGYLSYQIRHITTPPELTILNPAGQVTSFEGRTFVVSGQTEVGAEIIINSQEVNPDETGYFDLMLDLSPGTNIIRVEAKKRYSKTAIETREIIVSQP